MLSQNKILIYRTHYLISINTLFELDIQIPMKLIIEYYKILLKFRDLFIIDDFKRICLSENLSENELLSACFVR